MATMKFYNVTAVPTVSSAEGVYYVKDVNGNVSSYLVSSNTVQYLCGDTKQTTGQDTIKVMSQKAVTDELNNKVDKDAITQELAEKADLVGGLVPSEQLPSFVDDVVEIKTWSDSTPASPTNGDFWFAPTDKLLKKYVTGAWVTQTDLAGKIYIYYNATTSKTEKYRWNNEMLSIENPIDYTSQAEAEGNAENTKVMTALRVFQNWAKNVSTYVNSTLNTTSKTILGSINELSTNKVDKATQINDYPLTGDVTLTKGDVGLSHVDDTSDINKPISTSQQAALDGKLDKASVKQAIGTSTTDVVSQKAVMDELALKEATANKQNSLATDGTGTKFPTVDAVNTGLSTKLDTTAVKQVTGASITDVISQKTVTDALENKADHGYSSNPKSLKQVEDLKENLSNKQNSLTVDGTGTKFPTVDAVNSGLVAKTAVKQTTGASEADVMSQKAVTDAITNAIAYDLWYGVEWDSAVSSPDGTRIGNPTLHRTLPVHNMLKGVLLADDGTENLVLPDNSWIEQTRDGSMGQVMVKIPNYYFKCEQDGTKFRFKISTTKLAGYRTFFDESIPYVYCSAYEAGLDRTNLKLTSIVNSSTQYRGGNNNSSWDGTYRSLLNIPVIGINRTNFRTYARNRNTNNTYWNEYIYTIHVMVAWLFYTEYATLNSQKDYNAQLDANGYKQGGLGKGVSDISDWGGYNGYNPFIPNGISDSLGNNSGVVNYNVIASDGSSTYYVAQVPRYRGIQNPFGHIWKWSDGINIKEDGTTRTAYVTTHPSKFSDTAYDGYENRGTISHSDGWTTKMLLGAFGDLMPTNVGGSSSTYWCDNNWINTTPGLYGALLGGNANGGAPDGFGCVATFSVPSVAATHIGSRLCFVKEA